METETCSADAKATVSRHELAAWILVGVGLIVVLALHLLSALLAGRLLMEASFGVSGIVAAPIYYAYLEDELGARELV